MGKILEVNNLKISFRTQSGTLKAVRNISFDLEKGETLAIVGESGSGKSVTSKAILGILAGNSIVEGGEILFDGKDLLKIDEEEMHKIRGDKIAMIFQDPLSSLNPIVKIGRQITEAMLLKNKAARKVSRKEFNSMLALLKQNLVEVDGTSAEKAISDMITTFDKFNIEGLKLENAYNESYTKAEEIIADVDDLVFLVEKNQKVNVADKLTVIIKAIAEVRNQFLTAGREAELDAHVNELTTLKASFSGKSEGNQEALITELNNLRDLMQQVISADRPDFFRIGFYAMQNPEADLTAMPVSELNEMTLRYLDENFMKEFIAMETRGVAHSFQKSIEAKKVAIESISAAKASFAEMNLNKSAAKQQAKALTELVKNCIDRLDPNKDSLTYTFETSIDNAIDKYFYAVVNNPREQARFEKQSLKREMLIKRGKTVDWKVVPATIYDLAVLGFDNY